MKIRQIDETDVHNVLFALFFLTVVSLLGYFFPSDMLVAVGGLSAFLFVMWLLIDGLPRGITFLWNRFIAR